MTINNLVVRSAFTVNLHMEPPHFTIDPRLLQARLAMSPLQVVLSNCLGPETAGTKRKLQIISLSELRLSSANNPAQGGRSQAMVTYAKARTTFR